MPGPGLGWAIPSPIDSHAGAAAGIRHSDLLRRGEMVAHH